MISNKMIAGLLGLLLLFGLVGCGSQQVPSPASPIPPAEPLIETVPEIEKSSDTYWVACQWHSSDGEGSKSPFPMESDSWMVDLLLCADGTACLRDIHDGLYLMDEADLQLTWTQDADGTIHFSNDIYLNTIYHATWEEKELLFDYRGTILTMKQADMPKDTGERFHPAELAGTWITTSENTQTVESLVFKTAVDAEHITLTADYERRDPDGNLTDAFYAKPLEVSDAPLYEGCANAAWHVQIHTDLAFRVALLDRNTLLVQRGSAGEQTFCRMPERLTWWDIQPKELGDTGWGGPDDLYLYLYADGIFQLGRIETDGSFIVDTQGTWTIANGGLLLLQGENFRYIGGVSGYCYETEDGFLENYDMVLHNGAQLYRLSFQGYG